MAEKFVGESGQITNVHRLVAWFRKKFVGESDQVTNDPM